MTAGHLFDLNTDKKTLFVFGGSQGSEALNRCTKNMLKFLDNVQLLWQTGKNNIEKYKQFETDSVRVMPFINDMKSAYALSDLSFSRAGALTIAELTACGLPAILVPLPSAAADHQTHNAQSMVDGGAAALIPETELEVKRTSEKIMSLLNNEKTLNDMSSKSKELGKPNAVNIIVDHILEKVQT